MASKKRLPKYKTTVTQVRDFPGARETTIKISRPSNSKRLDVWEMQSILTNMKKSLGPGAQLMVRAMNAQQMFTFKGYNEEELNIMDFDKYYQNKVSDEAKFAKFEFFEISSYIKTSPDAKSKGKKR